MTTNAAIVLLLQDETQISGDLEMTLAVSGFDVTTIVTCREALHRFDTLRPDIAIVGIELRDGSTHAIVERLVENGIPFVVHSGDYPSMHVGTPFAHGRWLNKRAPPDEIIAIVRTLLGS